MLLVVCNDLPAKLRKMGREASMGCGRFTKPRATLSIRPMYLSQALDRPLPKTAARCANTSASLRTSTEVTCRHGQNIAASASGLGVLVQHGRQSQPSSKLKFIHAGVGRKRAKTRSQKARSHNGHACIAAY